jgi:hypothetical protein
MKRLLTITVIVSCASTIAFGHWNVGDPYKMTNLQLPNPQGWDIDMTSYTLADDWKCSESGAVSDIHFWYSVEGQNETAPPLVPHFQSVKVGIYSDSITGTYSMPKDLLWERVFTVTATMVNGPFFGNQGWDDPTINSNCQPNNHIVYWQLNIPRISDPFLQREGEIYWLSLQVQPLVVTPVPTPLVGWKTTYEIFRDSAVYIGPAGANWQPVAVCTENLPTDFAFVITPEPATICLLAAGGLLLRKRKV